jgi:hypothetical protein
MESRHYPREHIDLDVSLMRQGSIMASAKVIDLSKGGVAIENPEVALNKGQILDLRLSKAGVRDRGTRVRAMVIHKNGERVGLMFASRVRF